MLTLFNMSQRGFGWKLDARSRNVPPLPSLQPTPRLRLGRISKRLGKKYSGHSDWGRRRLQWMLTLEPGDVINNCTLFNHVIVEPPEVWWRPPLCDSKRLHKGRKPARLRGKNGLGYRMLRHGLVIGGIELQTTSISCSGTDCGVTPALNAAQLLAQLKEYDREPDDEYYDPWLSKLILRMQAGEPVLDANLLLIPTPKCPDHIKQLYEVNVKALEQFGKRRT